MGGNAFKNTSSIKKENIDSTLDQLSTSLSDLNLGDLKTRTLGSVGKKPISGDIDLNIDYKNYDIELVKNSLVSTLGKDNVKYKPGTNQIFTSVPVHGTSDRVQVDFMFGDYNWQAFSYFSSTASEYKGLYRTELLKAITAYCSDFVAMENEEMVGRIGPTFFHDRGCIWRYRMRPFRKVGDRTKRTQGLKEVSMEEFEEMFPDSKNTMPATFTITSPEAFCLYFFDSKVKPEDLETYEQVRDLILADPVRYNKKKIFALYKERLTSLKQPIPDAIKNDFN